MTLGARRSCPRSSFLKGDRTMILDVTKPLVNFAGQNLKDSDGAGEVVDATIRMAFVNALLAPVQKDTGMDKMKKGELARKIYQNDAVELTVDEAKIIKDRIGEIYPPLVVLQLWGLLDK